MLLQPGSRPVPNYPDYILIRKLGNGAFGEVWHAHGPGGLDVALKFICLDSHARDVELRALDVMKTIRHPNLVSLFGAWHKDNWLILAMELCDCSLQDRLTEALGKELPGIPLQELLSYMSDAATGLDALNASQVQHRDVKPANLLLLASGVKVADFGLAKALEQTIASNSGAGTIAYIAPECFKGQLTQQSDQYSRAVTYHHLRTGRLLFKGDQAQVMYGHLELEPDLSLLANSERSIVARALAKAPDERWPCCRAFVDELLAVAQQWAKQREEAEAERKREEDGRRQEAERKGDAYRKAQDDCNKSKEDVPGTADAVSSELCWFCKRNKPNTAPEIVDLHFVRDETPTSSGSHFVYDKTPINVPRCFGCALRNWSKRVGIDVLILFLPPAICFLLAVLGFRFVGERIGRIPIVVGLLWLLFCMERVPAAVLQAHQRRLPGVQALLNTGWRLGRVPSQIDIGHFRKRVKWTQAEKESVAHLLRSWEASEAALGEQQTDMSILYCLKFALDESRQVKTEVLAKVYADLPVFWETYIRFLELAIHQCESDDFDRKNMALLNQMVEWWKARSPLLILPADMPTGEQWFCPKCRRRLFIQERNVGRKVKCSACQTVSKIPG